MTGDRQGEIKIRDGDIRHPIRPNILSLHGSGEANEISYAYMCLNVHASASSQLEQAKLARTARANHLLSSP